MATPLRHTWEQGNTRLHVAARYLRQSGLSSSDLMDKMVQQNPDVLDWVNPPVGTTIIIPVQIANS